MNYDFIFSVSPNALGLICEYSATFAKWTMTVESDASLFNVTPLSLLQTSCGEAVNAGTGDYTEAGHMP